VKTTNPLIEDGQTLVRVTNSSAYISSWLKRLKDDTKLVVQAAAQAQKAADFILGVEWASKG